MTKLNFILCIIAVVMLNIFATYVYMCESKPTQKHYDYNINIVEDTIWLYNGDGILLIKGRCDSLSSMIISDNL